MKTVAGILGIAAAVLLTACGQDLSQTAQTQAPNPSALESAFAAAAREYQVPVGVLKALSYVETRVSAHGGQASQTGGWGVMHLVERDDWNMLERAAELTGAEVGRLKVDPRANIRGAAAVLRERFDALAREDTSLNAAEPGDWFQAVSYYPGIDSAVVAMEYATEVFQQLERGFEVQLDDGVVALAPTASKWLRHAPGEGTRRDAVKEYPGAVAFVQSPNYSSSRSSYEFVVIHTMQGSYSGCKSWFLNPNSNVSSHYIVRSSDGEITQMVEHRHSAWHAQCYNGRSIGIEHEGYVADPGRWYTDAMYNASAALTRWIANRHGIPKNRTHIIGHVEVAPGCNTGRHTDPGSGWNWTKYMNLVNGSTPTPSTGVLIGAIYTGGNSSNRISGATVTVNGQSVASDSSGIYQFTLPPGTYTATVTKSGYGSNSVTRTVTSGNQIWGSMEINPVAAATGTLRGKVFVTNPNDPADMTQALSGATVTVNNQTQTTGADGMYVFTLPPGTYTARAAKSGYQASSLSRTVTSGATIWGSIGLAPAVTPDTTKPQVAITFPQDGAQLDLGQIELKGTATDDRGAVGKVFVSLNGGAETEAPVSNGGFAVDVQLEPGSNTIAVRAVDGASNADTATSTATFNAGVSGFVYVTGDEASRVSGATVELKEPGSNLPVSTGTTDANGAFALAVGTVDTDYVLVVRASGFQTSTQTVTVPGDQRLTVNVPLTVGEGGGEDFALSFVEPMEGATVNTPAVVVYGQVTGFDVQMVNVAGVNADLVGAGGFSATVPLDLGDNTIEAVAFGPSGETVSALLHLTRVANVPGQPVDAINPEPVAGSCSGCSVGLGFEALALLGVLPLVRRRRRR